MGKKFEEIPALRYIALLVDMGDYTEVSTRTSLLAQSWDMGRLVHKAYYHFALGRAEQMVHEGAGSCDLNKAKDHLDNAIETWRNSGLVWDLPRGLIARAALYRTINNEAGARRDLDEAMRIARRGEMRLLQCDAHLEYARLALAEGEQEKAREHVVEARRLVEETGYGRRRPEVEALEALVG